MKMFNTIILLKGNRTISAKEYENFRKGDTIFGVDSDPQELKRWDSEEKEAAVKELAKCRCSYNSGSVWDIEEYALQYCTCEDGEFLGGADYDLAEEA